jgi:hypothetical protein
MTSAAQLRHAPRAFERRAKYAREAVFEDFRNRLSLAVFRAPAGWRDLSPNELQAERMRQAFAGDRL